MRGSSIWSVYRDYLYSIEYSRMRHSLALHLHEVFIRVSAENKRRKYSKFFAVTEKGESAVAVYKLEKEISRKAKSWIAAYKI